MEVREILAYDSEMTWRDFATDEEMAALEQKRAAKDAAKDDYNAEYRKLKIRCDARMRRAKSTQEGEDE